MLDLEEWMEIKAMKREGHSIREITRRTGRSRNTIRKVLRNRASEAKSVVFVFPAVSAKRTYKIARGERSESLGTESSIDPVRNAD